MLIQSYYILFSVVFKFNSHITLNTASQLYTDPALYLESKRLEIANVLSSLFKFFTEPNLK